MRVKAGISIVLAAALATGCSAIAQEASSAPTDGVLLVANKRGDSLSRIALADGTETGRVDTCANPHELAVSPDGAHVAVACYDGSTLEVYAVTDLARVKRIELGEGARPHGVVWHASGMIVASAEGRGSIFVVADPMGEAPQVTEIVSGEPGGRNGPHLLVVDKEGDTAWGTVIPTASVVRYDLANGREAGRAALSGETEAIALDPDGASLWVGANAANRAYRLTADTLEIEHETATGATPIRIAMHPSGRWAVTSNFAGGSLSVIDTETGEVARTIAVSGDGEAMQVTLVFSKDGTRLYAAETAHDTIAEIDFESGEVLRRLPTGAGGDGLAVIG